MYECVCVFVGDIGKYVSVVWHEGPGTLKTLEECVTENWYTDYVRVRRSRSLQVRLRTRGPYEWKPYEGESWVYGPTLYQWYRGPLRDTVWTDGRDRLQGGLSVVTERSMYSFGRTFVWGVGGTSRESRSEHLPLLGGEGSERI